MKEPGTITHWLHRLHDGDDSALDELMPLIYNELHFVAQQRLKHERPGHTFGATALVNEVYLKLINNHQLDLADRGEFMALASSTMRNILVDYARKRKSLKRGGGQENVPFDKVEAFLSHQESEEILALDAALSRLSAGDERAGLVVQYRFFGGLTLEETANEMDISKRSVQRSWTMAKAWLRKEIAENVVLE